jgi:hypothetical protein
MATTVSRTAVITVYMEIVEMYFVTNLPDIVWTDVRLVGMVISVTSTVATTVVALPATGRPETVPSAAWAGGMALSAKRVVPLTASRCRDKLSVTHIRASVSTVARAVTKAPRAVCSDIY